jgi:general stress protein 26
VELKMQKIFETLIKKSHAVILTTINDKSYPSTRAMLNLSKNTLQQIWFTTNTSSSKIEQIKDNEKASVYFYSPDTWQGLLLIGKIKIIDDMKIKKSLWEKGWEMYYSKGVEDPDYSVLCFDTKTIEYYSNLKKEKYSL